LNLTGSQQRTMRRSPAIVFGITLSAVAVLVFRWVGIKGDRTVFSVRTYGAKGNGLTKDTLAIQTAIDAAARVGDGAVLLPPGRYLSGTLHLRSNVTFRLTSGATLIASRDDADFDPYEHLPAGSFTRALPTWVLASAPRAPLPPRQGSGPALTTIDDPATAYAHYSLIVGDNVNNVRIEGDGVIDGNRTRRGGPKLIALKNCRHITIRGITLRNAPNYNISLIGTEYADLENLTIVNGYADGIDPDNSHFVRIANCYIDSWDDAICAKASLGLGRRLGTENLVVKNCVLRTSNNGFKFGTESEGNLRNVSFSNSVILRRARGRAPITGIAIESVDGGTVSGVSVANIVMRAVRTPIFLRLGNRGRGMTVPRPGRISDVVISNVTALYAAKPSSIDGLLGSPICQIKIANVDVQETGGHGFTGLEVPELPEAYPQGEMFGVLPAYSLYARHVDGLTVSNWRARWEHLDSRPAAVFDDVRDLRVARFDSRSPNGPQPLILLRSVERAWFESVYAANPGALLVGTEAVTTGNVGRHGGQPIQARR